MRAGYIVLADRYVYTAYARDIVRGCSPKWVCKVYDFAIKPDVVFYFRVPVDVAVERILVGRPKLKYYEAGMDLNLSNDQYDSYRIFQSRIIEQHESMVKSDGFVVIDGASGIEEQQQAVRNTIMKLLPHQVEKQNRIVVTANK
jgi:dTMP kinase